MSVVVGSSVVMEMYRSGRTRAKSKCLDHQMDDRTVFVFR